MIDNNVVAMTSIHDSNMSTLSQELKNNLSLDLQAIGKLKQQTYKVMDFYKQMNLPLKADRLYFCGTVLEFLANKELTKAKLNKANFCKDSKVCPLCADRRQRQESLAMMTMMRAIDHSYSLHFATFTVSNSAKGELDTTLDILSKGISGVIKKLKAKGVYQGAIVSLEINATDTDFHPHIHALFALSSDTMSRKWISDDEWYRLWRDSVNLPCSPKGVKVKRIKDLPFWLQNDEEESENPAYAIFGYLSKMTLSLNMVEDLETFEELYSATYRRKMISYRGIFKTLKTRYNLGELDKYKPKQEEFKAYYRLICRWYRSLGTYLLTELDQVAFETEQEQEKNPTKQSDLAG